MFVVCKQHIGSAEFWKLSLNKGLGLMSVSEMQRIDNIITQTSNLVNVMLNQQGSQLED